MFALIPRILSVLGPLLVYASLGLLLWALFKNRERLDRHVPAVIALALVTSFVFVDTSHRLFFDEDIYIQIASNLSRAPVAQLTLLGTPDTVQVSTYYKEPPGYPSLLGLVYAVTGVSESVAFVFARLLFALAASSVYLLARDLLKERWLGWAAALMFLTTPVVLDHSVSAGTDVATALFAVVGIWGLVNSVAPVAVAGLVLVSQMRLEAIVLIVFLLWSPPINRRWKLIGAGLVLGELFHVLWVLSGSPAYAGAVGVESTFSAAYVLPNLIDSAGYLFDGARFPWGIPLLAVLAILAFVRQGLLKSGPLRKPKPPEHFGELHLLAWVGLIAGVYLVFYAGSFELNPRYSIQIVVPLILLALGALRFFSRLQRVAVAVGVGITVLYANLGSPANSVPGFLSVLAADHERMISIAANLNEDDVVIASEPEVFLNQGVAAMNAVFATDRPATVEALKERYARVWYYAGARATLAGGEQWRANRSFVFGHDLERVESFVVGGRQTALYRFY